MLMAMISRHPISMLYCSLHVFLFIDNIVKIASLHGIEAIIKAMSTHKNHVEVQWNACGALMRLAANNGGFCLSFFSSFQSYLLLFF